jgi:predicted outer membrane repeat protein
MRSAYLFVGMSIFCLFSSVLSAQPIYVSELATGNGDGSSWDDAFTVIQDAIDLADPYATVLVGPGTYDENLDMKGKAITLTGTDPNDPATVHSTVIHGGGLGRVITCVTGETPDTVIAGLRIQNGDAGTDIGGGVYCNDSNPVIQHCVFADNAAASWGGAIACWGGAPSILNCTFIGNTSSNYGGAIGCYDSDATIANCLFSGNTGVRGGGIGCYLKAPTVTNCSFSSNTGYYGGAIYCNRSNLVAINSILWGNSATHGKEIYLSSASPSFSYCVVEGGWSGSGSNNLISDPLFIDPDGDDDIAGTDDDNLNLDGYSVCINAGDAAGDYAGQLDVSGYARVLYGRVDIGAFEVYPIGGDLSVDGQVDLADLTMFVDSTQWLVDVDLEDFALLAGQWMLGVE